MTLFSAAQERHNYLAVNGELADDTGPYYFVSYGDSANAFVKATPIAEALGLRVSYLEGARVLRFTDGARTVEFQATSDVTAGLVKRDGVVTVTTALGSAHQLASPQALLVGGIAYVAVTPLVSAFDGEAGWNPAQRVITVDMTPVSGYLLAKPRTGQQEGFSRVAVDIPLTSSYQVAVGAGSVLLTLPGARGESGTIGIDDGHLSSVAVMSSEGGVTLRLNTRHEVDADGNGFRVGAIDKADVRTVYVDLAPTLVGMPVAAVEPAQQSAERREERPVALTTVPESRQVVVIDAGHGGHDPGASSDHATEKWVVLAVSLKLKALLEREGIEVVMTRDDDTFLTLQQRSRFSSSDRNIFISIHANAASKSSASGVETWVFGEPLEPSMLERAIQENGGGAEGQALTEEARLTAASLAKDILREAQLNYSLDLAETVQEHLVSATGAVDRGVRRNLFYVIRNASIPAILVELGFVSNPDEGPKLADEAYQQKLARALADAVLQFLRGDDLTAQR